VTTVAAAYLVNFCEEKGLAELEAWAAKRKKGSEPPWFPVRARNAEL
jgi:hypothetical protein